MQRSEGSSPADRLGTVVNPALLLLGFMLAGLVAWSVWRLHLDDKIGFVAILVAHAVVFLGGIWLLHRQRSHRHDLLLILGIALLLRCIAITAPPALTTDAYRYLWDGRVQAAGVNPYLYVPADERLAHLRDDSIYPNINRKETYPTIYPPAAELLFLGARIFGDSVRAIQTTMLACELLIMAGILAWLRADGLPRERILIYAWHPLPLWEFTGQGHLDAAVVALVVLAIVAAHRGRQILTGVLLAAAVLVKYPAILFAPALWRRWRPALPSAMLATATVLYLPYVWGAGLKVIGSLFMHLDEEGYRDGFGFYLVAMPKHLGWPHFPSLIFAGLAAVTLLALGLRVLLARSTDRVDAGGLILLTSAYFVLISPHYPWYYAIAVPILCRRMSLGLLFLSLAVMGHYLDLPAGPLEPYTRIKVFTFMFAGAALFWLGQCWFSRLPQRAGVTITQPGS